ncbi:MAG: DUF4388 domain-containing protein [bacterium]
MILWGNIREFPLFGVLQFLASQRITGVLEIQDFEEYGAVYLFGGRIEAISMPLSDEALGARLVSVGALTEKKAKECWMRYPPEDGGQSVVAGLLEAAKGEREALVEIVNRHTADQVMQLMYWSTGTFRFVVPPQPIRFAVAPSIDVENLLLEAYRRVDEGERPQREKISVDEEFCLTCTIECSPEIKSRYLKPDVCLWRNMPSVLKDPIFRRLRDSDALDVDDTGELPFL